VQTAASDERRESLNSTQSNGQKARRGSNSSSGYGSIGSGTNNPHAQTWTAIQTARSELDKDTKAKKVRVLCMHTLLLSYKCSDWKEYRVF
jgi:hypothetical protein